VLDGAGDVAERVEVLDLARVPSFEAPRGRTETFASQRSEPSSMLTSETSA
jgi:hypothetical protein